MVVSSLSSLLSSRSVVPFRMCQNFNNSNECLTLEDKLLKYRKQFMGLQNLKGPKLSGNKGTMNILKN